ncbi:uncharacterized protein LOC117901048 [Drosophila subobscura]|uniref:uncharacterized protein LOC117901048 n=1 Tax=Drosophila subobscura TaxID=7241 RepID=UPI00155AF0BD|nr:uncharacterized protein LOC117901048 [Drosophila subobscura]
MEMFLFLIMTSISIMWLMDHRSSAQNEGRKWDPYRSQWDLEEENIEPAIYNQSTQYSMLVLESEMNPFQRIPERYRNFLNWDNQVHNYQRIKRHWDPAHNESLDYRENLSAFPSMRSKRKGKVEKVKYPLKPHIEYNRRPMYGELYHIIVTLPSLGREKFVMNLTVNTGDYLIDEVIAEPWGKPNPWHYTTRLPSILQMYGIRVGKLPYRRCYFYHTHASYFNSLHRYVYITITSFKDRSKLLARKARRDITIVLPRHMHCDPFLNLPFCKDPNFPVDVSPRSHLQFFAELGDDCKEFEYDHIDWNFYDISERHLIGHAGVSKGLVLKIPPYKVKFKYTVSMGRYSFLLRANALINGVNCVARCYVRMVAVHVEPRIQGNIYRRVNAAREIILDGERSRDRSRARKDDYSRIFSWGCFSRGDPKNKYCRDKMSTKSVMKIPANSLQPGKFYNYSLTLFSRIDARVNATDYQMLEVVNERTITPHIRCRRNCYLDVFAPIDSIHLMAECFDCDAKIFSYKWYVHTDKSHSMESPYSYLVYRSNDAELQIRLEIMLVDGMSGEAHLKLRRNDGPQNGECIIWPNKGLEAYTSFYVGCTDFRTNYPPLQFRYSIRLGVIDSNVPYSLFKTTLPATKKLYVSICDYLDMCVDVTLMVKVLKTDKIGIINVNNTLRHLLNIRDYISKMPYMLKHGRWNKAYVIALVAAQRIHSASEGREIFAHLNREAIMTGTQIEQLSVLAAQLMRRLSPMDYRGAALISKIFTRMSLAFEEIIEQLEWLHRAAYNSLTDQHMFFLYTLASRTEIHAPAQCKTYDDNCNMGQNVGLEENLEMEVDPITLLRINWWLKVTWYLYKCIYYLGVLGTSRHHAYDEAMTVLQGGIAYQMNVTEISHSVVNLTVDTIDGIHHVQISTALMEELDDLLRGRTILFQIISQQNVHNMYWWYPEPLPSETNVLIVHAYSPLYNYPMGSRLPLKHPLVYYMNISDFSANPEFVKWMANSTIQSASHIHYYTIPLRSRSVLAVRIVRVTDPIRISMSLNEKPKLHEIREKACLVTPDMKGKRIWMTNNCPDKAIAYVGVLSDKYKLKDEEHTHEDGSRKLQLKHIVKTFLNYSVLLETYQCNSWANRSLNPGWSTDHCTTKLDNENGMFVKCTCDILGPLASRIFPVVAERYITVMVLPILETNWYMFTMFLMLFLLLMAVLLSYIGRMAAHQHRHVQECRHKSVRFKEDMTFDSEKDLLVLVRTGGQEFAGTTSNIKLYFKSRVGKQSSYIISQDPARPRLVRNSINKITLPAGTVKIPTRLAFGIERNGRYPRWYCRTVTIIDLNSDMEQLFIVERWIEDGHTPFIRSPYFTRSANERPVLSWTRRFRNSFEQRFLNWFLVSPMTGPWLSRNTLYTMTRFERSCVWICNVSLTILLVSLYFGPSPFEAVPEEVLKEEKRTTVKIHEVVALGVYSGVIGICVLLFFEFVIMRLLWRRH